MPAERRRLYLCAGLQSSGSTLVSWCFLQRADMDGVLDARFDMLPTLPVVSSPRLWCKFTVACFRFSEVADHFRDEGFDVSPVLVARDVRPVFQSMLTKSYARNGTTADDPPLRLRLRRFKADWQLFRDHNWPILRFESLCNDGEKTLRDACSAMELEWDDGMIHWKKAIGDIAAAGYGNETFLRNRQTSLAASIKPQVGPVKVNDVPPADLQWMEEDFAEFNRVMDYPEHLAADSPTSLPSRAVPSFEATRRYDRIAHRSPLRRLVRKLTGTAKLTPDEVAEATGVPQRPVN